MAIMDGKVKGLNCNFYIVVDVSSSMCFIERDIDVEEQFLHMIEDIAALINKNDVCERRTEKKFLGYHFQNAYFYGNNFKVLLVRSVKRRNKNLNTLLLRISIVILLLGKFFIVKLLNTDPITCQEKNMTFY